MARILITGGAGFVGFHTCMEAAKRGHDVIAVDSFSAYYDTSLKRKNAQDLKSLSGIQVMEVDLASGELPEIFDGIDAVVHLAGQPGVRSSWIDFDSYCRENILVTNRVLEQCVKSSCRRIIFASSSSVYGNATRYPVSENDPTSPRSPYGVTKLSAEKLVRAYSENFPLPSICLRYFTIYGPRQRPDMAFAKMVSGLRTGKSFHLLGDGNQTREFTYVGDVASANLNAVESELGGSEVLNISGGSEISVNEAIHIFESIAGKKLKVIRDVPAVGDVLQTCASNEKARELLQWDPLVSLMEGLELQYLSGAKEEGENSGN